MCYGALKRKYVKVNYYTMEYILIYLKSFNVYEVIYTNNKIYSLAQ
jgi:hypothetical protein